MLKTVEIAAENFCIHQIRENHTVTEGVSKKKTFIAYIDIETFDSKKHRVYIASDTNFMQKISKLFLEEDESDEETLIDMTLETANLIIGSAKVIAEELNKNPYTISTPHFVKIDTFDLEFDEIKSIQLTKEETITVAIKEIDA